MSIIFDFVLSLFSSALRDSL